MEIREECTAKKVSLTKGIEATRLKVFNSGAAGADWVSVAIVWGRRARAGFGA